MADLDLQSARSRGQYMLVRRRATQGERPSSQGKRPSATARLWPFAVRLSAATRLWPSYAVRSATRLYATTVRLQVAPRTRIRGATTRLWPARPPATVHHHTR